MEPILDAWVEIALDRLFHKNWFAFGIQDQVPIALPLLDPTHHLFRESDGGETKIKASKIEIRFAFMPGHSGFEYPYGLLTRLSRPEAGLMIATLKWTDSRDARSINAPVPAHSPMGQGFTKSQDVQVAPQKVSSLGERLSGMLPP